VKSGATPNSAVFSFHKILHLLLGTFTLVTLQPFGTMGSSLDVLVAALLVVFVPSS